MDVDGGFHIKDCRGGLKNETEGANDSTGGHLKRELREKISQNGSLGWRL